MLDKLDDLLPTYSAELPFSKQTVTFTPFKVKDAKNISIILQENNKKLALIALVNILKNCSKNVSIDELCLADAEYLFLQIRGKSVEEHLTLIFNDVKKQININELKTRNEIATKELQISPTVKAIFETPKIKDLIELNTLDKEDIMKACLKRLVVKNEIYYTNKFVPEQLKNIIDNLPLSFVVQSENFIKSQPELYAEIEFNNETKEVSGILNFFTYR